MISLYLGPLKEAVENLEGLLIEQAMKGTGGHQTRADEALGISERMLRAIN
ncbi:MAG: hypothetical protein K9K88_03755 [Desulfobacterales bacterium]|nr:hypothetical protein [Desulfobacterales bacterium]